MKKTMKQSLLITSLLAASFCVGGGVAAVNAAANETVAPVEFATTFGAEIRASAPNGIRFKLQLSEEKKAEIFKADSNKTLGMFIFLGSKTGELSETTTPSQKIDISFEESDLYQVGDYWYAHGVMTNLYVQNFNKQFIGVGYVATAGETTTYEYSDFDLTDNVRSMSYVAIEGYKVKPQTYLLDLIEKAVYAEYGVVETREVEGEAVTYSFAKGEDKWTSYEDMKADIPVTVSVAENDGELTIGETYDLNAALAIGTTKISGLDIPFTYETQSEAITLENGVVTAVADGEAEITVSFGDYSKTVTLNVSEKANVVFNPAAANAAEQVSYSTVNMKQTFVSAGGALADDVYSGAYMRTQPNNSGWFNVILRSKYEVSAYEQYDVITSWLYVESSTDEPVNVLFFNDTNLTQAITPNQWVQVNIARSRFMEKIGANYFCSINYGTATAINIGEIVAEHAPANVVFDPTTADATKISTNKTSTISFTQASNNAATTYDGAYAKVVPSSLTTSNNWVNISIMPINEITSYVNYTHIKVWVYVETGTAMEVKPLFGGVTYVLMSKQWVDIDIPVADYVANAAQPFFGTNFNTNGITGICIGEIVAITKEVRNDVFFFNPTSQNIEQLTINGKAFNYGNAVTTSYAISATGNYVGAYVQINSTALTSSNVSGNVYITPNDMSAYAGYTTIKAWIYLDAISSANQTLYIYGAAYVDTIPTNQWVQISIPVNNTLLDSESIWLQTNFAKAASWGVTGIRIGEIVAV